MLLALAALAEGREVLVSRGELIEIGDGFRIPDVLERSGARLREVGTTNRTRAGDYETAIGPETAVLLRVHQSNFRVVGFTARLRWANWGTSPDATACHLWTISAPARSIDIGDEPTARAVWLPAPTSSASPATSCWGARRPALVGRADLVEKLRRHPLQRALRADKLTLAALEGTLTLAIDAPDEIPVLRMLREPPEAVRTRAAHLANLVGGEVEETVARAGGGSLPSTELPSFACAVEEELAVKLRAGIHR